MINKKTLFVTAVLILFSLAPHVLAQGFVPLAPIEGLTKGVAANTEGLAIFFNNLYKFAIGMATVLAVIMIIWGGIEYSWQDVPGAKSNGKDRILQAILGLVLVLSPALVFSIINPSILNLSINLKPLDTKSGTSSVGSRTVTDAVTTATAAGCTITDTGPLVKRATCTTQKDAQNFSANCNRAGGNGNVPFFNHRYEGTVEIFWATCDTTPPSPVEESTNDDLLNPN